MIFYNEKIQKVKKLTFFPKGLTHGLGTKMAIFPIFFFRQFRPGKCLFRYSKKKNAVLRYKSKKSKKPKNWHFSKGVNRWFWSKNCQFCNFFFLSNLAQENVFYDILEWKNAFLYYKKKEVKKLEKLTFFPSHGFDP